MVSNRGKLRTLALIVIAGVLVLLYLNGRFDTVLYRFGLNHRPCTHTASGGVLCGTGIAGTPYGDAMGGGGGGSGGGALGAVPAAVGGVGGR